MLERVHGVVVERRVVQERHVPEVEVDGPDRQRDERVRQHAQAFDDAELEHRPQDRPAQTRDEAERREVADDHVLQHVHEEEVLLAELVDRRVEREYDEGDPAPERDLPPDRDRLAPPGERARAPEIERGGDHGRQQLKGLEAHGRESDGESTQLED